ARSSSAAGTPRARTRSPTPTAARPGGGCGNGSGPCSTTTTRAPTRSRGGSSTASSPGWSGESCRCPSTRSRSGRKPCPGPASPPGQPPRRPGDVMKLMDGRVLHPRAFKATVGWTLGLLFLGSVVHATESSLACPDWPTCYGTMMPEMTGGIFWEHLHRLVAGGLVLLFLLATWLVRREVPARRWMFRASLAGVGLLVVRSVFGGLTVLFQLPDLVSTTHLALAFLFLTLATVLASRAHRGPAPEWRDRGARRRLGILAATGAGLVFAQSVLGGLVRHMDAGMSCPDAPLCLGQFVPPLINRLIVAHFA